MKNVLIFDYDGVLVDSLELFMKHFIFACKKEGFNNVSSKKDFLKLFEKNMYESMFELGMSKKNILNIVYYMRDQLLKNQDKLDVFPGIKETLESLSKNNILVIVTSNDTRVVESFIKSHEIDFFDEIVGSDKEASKIAKIKKIKTLFDGDNFFYIGDTTGDILEGKRAGVKTIGVSWGWHSKNKLKKADPDFLIDNPDELINLLEK